MIYLLILFLGLWSALGGAIFVDNHKKAIRNNKKISILIIGGPIVWIAVSVFMVLEISDTYFGKK